MDRWTDMKNLIVAFCGVVNASEIDICLIVGWLWLKCIKDENGRQNIKW
jgi:hypothetical protein